jgi:DNA-binding response OmpR family regulator
MRRVLLIEDEANIAEALRFILARDGWQVLVCADGAEGLALAEADPPDLLVLDLMLPTLSGLEVLMVLRSAEATRHLPVLMLTAKGQERDRAAAAAAGVSAFMTKPFDNAEIRARVRALLEA